MRDFKHQGTLSPMLIGWRYLLSTHLVKVNFCGEKKEKKVEGANIVSVNLLKLTDHYGDKG